MNMSELTRLTGAQSRSICPENRTGEKGKGGAVRLEDGSAKYAASRLGIGWKVNPYLHVASGEKIVMADIKGSGAITHIWCTPTREGKWRDLILRMYWDGQEEPSVECPIGDFFAMGWQKYAQINSLAVCVNPGSALNCYWEMPFRNRALITLENRGDREINIYYQIDYLLKEIPENTGYFHAQFRRVNPLPYKSVYTILDGVHGSGQYVGTYMCWGVNNDGWWGEGEVKFFIDGDGEFPTICGTGTEDYFCGSYNFEDPETHDHYVSFSSPYTGMQVIEPDRLYRSRPRFGLYRWHLNDPICFNKELKVTIQALGWRNDKTYLPLQDDISSVAFWYQTLPTSKFPELQDREALEII